MDIKEILARNVKKYRLQLGYSQEDLAGICSSIREEDGLSNRSFISDIENCRRNIALDKIELLALALEIEPYQLFLTKNQGELI